MKITSEQVNGYIKVIVDGEEQRRYSATHWEQKWNGEWEKIIIPLFAEMAYQQHLKGKHLK
jgi:hypothetical protein